MSDRELLEMAAKAVGLSIWKHGKTGGGFINNRAEAWDPLNNDGDALRLAVKLDIHIKRFAGATCAEEWLIPTRFEEHDHWADNAGDRMASTRRAIVRAAAERGSRMP